MKERSIVIFAVYRIDRVTLFNRNTHVKTKRFTLSHLPLAAASTLTLEAQLASKGESLRPSENKK